jgi:hypothetical protein
MSNESENKRIDFRFINSGISTRGVDILVDALKRCYEREDKMKALIKESIEALDGVDSLFSEEVVQLLRELASE